MGGIMPLFEVGRRYSVTDIVCTARGEESDIKEKCTDTIQPGKIYEIRYSVDPALKPEDIGRLYDFFKQLEAKYPRIGINYFMISDDGKTIVVQVFDPEEKSLVAISTIIFAILLVILAIFTYLTVTKIETIVGKVLEKVPTPPEWLYPVIWAAVALCFGGIGVYLIVTTFKRAKG
jgi:hypothetical protein